MSISSLMSIGVSAMQASYAQITTTSNNISNANTVGYSEEQANLAEAPGNETGAGFFGSGVDVTSVTRAYNQFLTAQANSTNSQSAADSSALTQLTQLEGSFTTGTSGIGYASGQLLNDFVNVSNTPSDSASRQVVLSQATQLASMISSAGNQIAQQQSGIVQNVSTSLATVNGLAQQVASLNKQISAEQASGQSPNSLMDQRDTLINQIGGYINVTTLPASDGTIGLFVGGGQNLVLGSTSSTLSTMPDTFNSGTIQIGVSNGGGAPVPVPTSSITGGSIGGMLQVQSDLTDGTNMLGQLATGISAAMNQQQSLGLDLNGNQGSALFSVGAPTVLAASTNHGTANVGISVSNASQLQASNYELHFDGTNYTLTRQSDNTTAAGSPFTAAQLAAGVTVDGMKVQLNSGAAQAGDTFLLQPVANAAQGMQTVLTNPSGIAAASPFTASISGTNQGTASVASVVASSANYNPALTANVTFTSNTGAYNWTLSNGTSGSGTWTAGNPISLNGFALQLSGVPDSGDSITVAPTSAVSSNNGNAQAFVALANSALVGGQTITNSYANTIANIGVRVQSATAASTASSAAAATAQTSNANSSGVNLDEEASRLIQFQQNYQAAAKVLQVAQSVFDTLIASMPSD